MIDISRARTVYGWMQEFELEWLAEMASKCKNILEVGSYHGRSTMALADNTSGKVTCIDPWEPIYHTNDGGICWNAPDAFDKFKGNLAEHIASGKVTYHKGVLENFPGGIFDFIFIDGDHRYEFVKKDIILARKFLKPGGVLAGHDYIYPEWPGVKQAVDELLSPIDGVTHAIWHKKL